MKKSARKVDYNNFYYEFLRKHSEDTNLSIELNTVIIPIDIYHHSLCPWGMGMLGIGYSGKVALCHVGSDNDMFIFDNVKENSISKIWKENEKLRKYKELDVDKLKGICDNCLARSLCRGGCRLHAMEDENKDCSYNG